MISGIVWLTSGVVATAYDISTGFAVLFFGGILIFPITSLVVRHFFNRPGVSTSNPGGLTVIETVFPMIGGLLAAWLLIPYRPEYVFPVSAIAVGAHYFGFRTAYGDWTNWLLGGIMCAAGVGSIFYRLPESTSIPFVIAALEIVFGIWFIRTSLTKESKDASMVQDGPIGG